MNINIFGKAMIFVFGFALINGATAADPGLTDQVASAGNAQVVTPQVHVNKGESVVTASEILPGMGASTSVAASASAGAKSGSSASLFWVTLGQYIPAIKILIAVVPGQE
ncbi:hypothetical protein [Denitratimonas sp. CY0512]|uniref:hypothetical protein n=1 Tax=Denitratimonas sp. CY0512 TaxID=3131940 RepID=UPI0030A1106D